MSTMLTINVHDTPAPLPSGLEERLNGSSPTKTPEELAEALSRHTSRVERLRSAHLEAVKDRAARETQRAAAAQEAKLRLAASRVEKVQRKLDRTQAKTTAVLEATQAEREARRARRAEMALAVAEARRSATETRESRLAALRQQESLAFSKHAKNIASIVHKSSWQVKHAIAVATAQKEKERADAEAAGQKLTERLEGAAVRRQTTPTASSSSPPVLHRVLNDCKVASETRRKLLFASMDRATSKRAAILQDVADKAKGENERAARVVAKVHAKGQGTDAETAATKAALYDRLLRAQVARLVALKQRTAFSAGKHGDTVSVIVIKVDKTPKMPPPALCLRLSHVPKTLLATADARQRGAAARRAELSAKKAMRLSTAKMKRAAAIARIGKRQALQTAAIDAKAARAVSTLGLAQGRTLFVVSEENRRIAAALARRSDAAQALVEKGEANAKSAEAATERHAAKMRTVAKKGVVALRAATNKSRRDARDSAIAKRGAALAARCAAATEARADILAARITLAQKHMKAKHPKHDAADMEIKDA